MKSRKKDDIDRFKEWLTSRGGEVLIPTNDYELVRFRGDGTTSIIYTNKVGARSFTGRARAAWDAFKSGDNDFRVTQRAVGISRRQRKKAPLIRTLLDRDGHACFYCAEPFTEALPPTKEHLVPVTAGGPDHIANLFLACGPCNIEAGHMSAAEKIRMRDRKRRGVGSQLLQKLLDSIVRNRFPFFPPLLEELQTFLHAVPAAQQEEE